MKLFALTIVYNERDEFTTYEHARAQIYQLIDVLHSQHYETGHLGFECQHTSPFRFHLHTFISGKNQPYFKRKIYSDIIKKNKLNVKCEALNTAEDTESWVSYCHKCDGIPPEEIFTNTMNRLRQAHPFDTLKKDDYPDEISDDDIIQHGSQGVPRRSI